MSSPDTQFQINADIAPEERVIVDRIYSAVMEQRIAPQTKLRENALCETFDCSRSRVRRALLILSQQGIVELKANRGAYIACPSAQEAHDIFEARLMIEPNLVRTLAEEIRPDAVQSLRQHIEFEDEARQQSERGAIIRLSGEFHVLLAEAHGNTVLTRILRDLVTKTSLIFGLFGSGGGKVCPKGEHVRIVDAIANGNADIAERELREHLQEIRDGLELDKSSSEDINIYDILGEGES